jgi:NADH-quinone oxidoreductase subunit M
MLVRGESGGRLQRALDALWTSLITFGLSLILWFRFDKSTADFQFVEEVSWLPEFGISYAMGVDGISVLFVLLSTALTPICILASWDSVQARVREYMVAFLVLETMMVGMFCAMDFMLFYVFFEAVLIPMFLIIGIWGGARRVYAAYKFFLYTLLGSVLMLLAVITLWYSAGTTSITARGDGDLLPRAGLAVPAFFASFAVKVPMWPVHTWLPDAHVEAPTAGSVILAGVLLKMGAYGFLRFSLPLLPEASAYFAPWIYVLSIVAVIYTSLVGAGAAGHEEADRLFVGGAHGHRHAGIFTFNAQGIGGACSRCCRTASSPAHSSSA